MSSFANVTDRLIEFATEGSSYIFCHANKQYIPFPTKISRCKVLKPLEKLVLIELLFCFGENNYAYPSLELLADRLNVDDKTISGHLKKLVEKNFITISHRPNRVNYYYIKWLECNPYIILSETAHWYMNTVQTRDIPKKDLHCEMLKVVSAICNSKEYDNLINDLCSAIEGIEEGSIEKREYYSNKWEDNILKFITTLNNAFVNTFGSKIRPVNTDTVFGC